MSINKIKRPTRGQRKVNKQELTEPLNRQFLGNKNELIRKFRL